MSGMETKAAKRAPGAVVKALLLFLLFLLLPLLPAAPSDWPHREKVERLIASARSQAPPRK